MAPSEGGNGDGNGDDEEEAGLPTMQKVAILFVAMGQESAGEVMKFLSDYESRRSPRP